MMVHDVEPANDQILDLLGSLRQHDIEPARAEHIRDLAHGRLERHQPAPDKRCGFGRVYASVLEPALVSTVVVVHLAWLATHLLH
jgi:hypothetical protein